jgi:RHS repeat-associated protein
VASPGQASVSGHAYVARTPETNTYDLDGNLLSDGRWIYSWDAENRLTNMTSLSGAPSGSQLNLSFVYDYMGRRIQKVVSTNNSGSNIVEYTDNYAYDGWNCVAILNSSLGLVNSFLWGSDLSGSMQGAGGVGGLVQVNYYGSSPTNGFVAYDGNGNVVALVNAADGSTLSLYDYGPFGELIRATGPMAKVNPFRFSTKYDDDESDLVYYGYRYYNPSTGRWLSRDPIEEDGWSNLNDSDGLYSVNPLETETGNNLYAYVEDSPENTIDLLGLYSISGRTITLSKCEIVIIYGHGSKKNHWTWNVPYPNCSAGAAVTCWPVENMTGLPDSMRLWTTWPPGGAALEDDWQTIMWGMAVGGPDFWQMGGADYQKMPNANKALYYVAGQAWQKAIQICNAGCGCHAVTIHYVEINKKGEWVNPPEPLHGVPVMHDAIWNCTTGGTICNQ